MKGVVTGMYGVAATLSGTKEEAEGFRENGLLL